MVTKHCLMERFFGVVLRYEIDKKLKKAKKRVVKNVNCDNSSQRTAKCIENYHSPIKTLMKLLEFIKILSHSSKYS